MANDENLKKPSSNEAREIGKKGGIKSGESRRRRKKLKATLESMMGNKIVLSQEEQSLYNKFNIQVADDNTVQERLIAVLLVKALKGDQQSIKYIFEITGEDPLLQMKKQELEIKKKLANPSKINLGTSTPKLIETLKNIPDVWGDSK